MTLTIEREQPGDAAAVREVTLRAFDGEERVADLAEALRQAPCGRDGLAWVARDGDDSIGYVLLTRGWVDAPDRLVDVLVLSPIGVVPERQRAGVGAALLERALTEAAAAGFPLVFLEGPPAYYSRRGFEPAGPLGFAAPSERIPEPAFQVATLSGFEPWMTGRLVYPDPFWALDCVGLR